MKAGTNLHQARHDTLIIDHNQFNRTGHDGELSHQMVSGHGNSLAHHHLIAGTTEACQINSGGTTLLCKSNQFRLIYSLKNHLGDKRVVAMHQNVHMIFSTPA